MITLDPEGVSAHRLDGLDCSGFASWVFNQITNKYNIDSAAMYFTRQDGIESLDIGSELLPGDMFALPLPHTLHALYPLYALRYNKLHRTLIH